MSDRTVSITTNSFGTLVSSQFESFLLSDVIAIDARLADDAGKWPICVTFRSHRRRLWFNRDTEEEQLATYQQIVAWWSGEPAVSEVLSEEGSDSVATP